MERKILKEINVISFILFLILIASCTQNDKATLFETYINDYKRGMKSDSLFIEENNSNELILKRFNKYLELEKDNKGSDSIMKTILSEFKLSEIKNQTVTETSWQPEHLNIKGVVFTDNKSNKALVHVSQPIYSSDGNYSMIYYYLTGKDSIIFIRPIDIYKKNTKSKWSKVYSLKATYFNLN